MEEMQSVGRRPLPNRKKTISRYTLPKGRNVVSRSTYATSLKKCSQSVDVRYLIEEMQERANACGSVRERPAKSVRERMEARKVVELLYKYSCPRFPESESERESE